MREDRKKLVGRQGTIQMNKDQKKIRRDKK